MMDRRAFLQAGAALALIGSSVPTRAMRGAKVVVIGGRDGGEIHSTAVGPAD